MREGTRKGSGESDAVEKDSYRLNPRHFLPLFHQAALIPTLRRRTFSTRTNAPFPPPPTPSNFTAATPLAPSPCLTHAAPIAPSPSP